MRSKYVRAQHEDGDSVRESLQKLFTDFARLLNGDHRKPRIEHYCHEPGCCEGQQRRIAIRDITEVLAEAFFSKLGIDLPASNKWWTFGPHLARQAGSMLVHRVLPRVALAAFTCAAVDDGDTDSFHAMANKKKMQAIDFLTNTKSAITLGVSAITIAPVDHLSFRLQHLDSNGTSCLELVDRSDSSLLLACQRSYWGLLNSWHAAAGSSQLASLWWHFESGASEDQADVYAMSMQACVGLAASVWVRLQLRYLAGGSQQQAASSKQQQPQQQQQQRRQRQRQQQQY